MKNHKLLGFLFAFGLVGGLVLRLLYASHLPLSNDEGSYLYDGLLLSQGKWPFLTSFSRSPALMFLTALAVKIFGRSFLAGRMISILAGLGGAYILYLIGRRLFNQRVGIAAFLLYALLAPCVVHTIYLHTQPLELFFVLAGVWFVVGFCKAWPCKRSKAWPFAVSGIFFGLAVLVRETAALYPAVMVLVIFALSEGKSGNRSHFSSHFKDAILMGVSSLLVWGGVWGFIVSQVGFGKVRAIFLAITSMHDTGEYMSFGFALRKKFEIFYGALGENFILYLLAAVFAIVLVKRVVRVVRGERMGKSWVFLLLFCASPFVFYGFYYKRMQAEYLAEFMPALVLMSAVALDYCISELQFATRSKLRYYIFPLFFILPSLFFNYRYQWENQHGGTFAPEALKEAIVYVEENVPPDEEIFTAAVIIPFLTGHKLSFDMSRPVIFGYPHLDPKIKYNLFPNDQEIINYLELRPVNWAVFDRTTWETFSRGHPEIEEYLKSNYNIVKTVPNGRTGTVLEIAARGRY